MSNGKKNPIDVLFYGERGIVNSILLDIENTENIKNILNTNKEIIKKIDFYNNNDKDIIKLKDDEDITNIKYLIEGTFGQFGDPDLMIRVEKNKNVYFFIIEAKVDSFEKSSKKFEEGNIAYKSNASKLNVQLALRARFMSAWKNKGFKNSDQITKETSIYENGGNYVNVDPDEYGKTNGRKLNKTESIKELFTFFENKVLYSNEDISTNVDIPTNVYYIALANEKGETKDAKKYASDYLINLLNPKELNGSFVNHFGMITYDDIYDKILKDNKNPTHFEQACETMNIPLKNNNE